MRILGLSGSLRQGSTNTALLFAARNVAARAGHEVSFYEPTLAALPHFNPDFDREAAPELLPEVVARFRAELKRAHAVLISTPEYAHGIPGVLKNALDWLVSDGDFVGKRIAVLMGSATEGGYAEAALLEVLRTMSTDVATVLNVGGARTRVRADGTLIDATLERELAAVIAALEP